MYHLRTTATWTRFTDAVKLRPGYVSFSGLRLKRLAEKRPEIKNKIFFLEYDLKISESTKVQYQNIRK